MDHKRTRGTGFFNGTVNTVITCDMPATNMKADNLLRVQSSLESSSKFVEESIPTSTQKLAKPACRSSPQGKQSRYWKAVNFVLINQGCLKW